MKTETNRTETQTTTTKRNRTMKSTTKTIKPMTFPTFEAEPEDALYLGDEGQAFPIMRDGEHMTVTEDASCVAMGHAFETEVEHKAYGYLHPDKDLRLDETRSADDGANTPTGDGEPCGPVLDAFTEWYDVDHRSEWLVEHEEREGSLEPSDEPLGPEDFARMRTEVYGVSRYTPDEVKTWQAENDVRRITKARARKMPEHVEPRKRVGVEPAGTFAPASPGREPVATKPVDPKVQFLIDSERFALASPAGAVPVDETPRKEEKAEKGNPNFETPGPGEKACAGCGTAIRRAKGARGPLPKKCGWCKTKRERERKAEQRAKPGHVRKDAKVRKLRFFHRRVAKALKMWRARGWSLTTAEASTWTRAEDDRKAAARFCPLARRMAGGSIMDDRYTADNGVLTAPGRRDIRRVKVPRDSGE